jgi:hypothetical protein
MGAALLFGQHLSSFGSRSLLRWRLAWVRGEVERLASDFEAGRRQAIEGRYNEFRAGFGSYAVDAGPPVRIAVRLPGGLLDNWCGIVRDPTGVVMSPRSSMHVPANSSNCPDRRRQVTDLFGGVLVSCHLISPPYYHCCFS